MEGCTHTHRAHAHVQIAWLERPLQGSYNGVKIWALIVRENVCNVQSVSVCDTQKDLELYSVGAR